MTKIFVTGAAGALGTAIVARFARDPANEVIASSRSGSLGHQLDVLDTPKLLETLDALKPDMIIQLAATFGDNYDDAFALNVGVARTILEQTLQTPSPARIVLIGSAAEYGVVAPQDNPVGEDRLLQPVSIYGLTKAWQTQLAGVYAARGANVVVARPFNLQGPTMSDQLFIGRVQKQIAEIVAGRTNRLEIGPLSAIRDYLTTDEAAEQIHATALHGESGQAYNVASGKAIRMRDLLEKLLEKNGLTMAVVQENPASSTRKGYDVPEIYADIRRVQQLMVK